MEGVQVHGGQTSKSVRQILSAKQWDIVNWYKKHSENRGGWQIQLDLPCTYLIEIKTQDKFWSKTMYFPKLASCIHFLKSIDLCSQLAYCEKERGRR